MIIINENENEFEVDRRMGNYLTAPNSVNDVLQIINKVARTNDVDEQIHFLEVVRDTITRFPGLTGRGLKGKLQRALNALNPRSSVEPTELPGLLQSIGQLLRSRAARRAASEVDLWTTARRVALLNRATASSKQDLFDRTLAAVRRLVGPDRSAQSPFLLRYAYNAAEQAFMTQLTNRAEDSTLEWVDGELMKRASAHTQAEVDYTTRIVGEHMKAFIKEQQEAEASGDEGGALMTTPEGILDEGLKFLVYLVSNEPVITGFPALPPPAVAAVKKLTTDSDFRQAVYDQVEAEYGIDLDQAQPADQYGIGSGHRLTPSAVPQEVAEEPARYSEEDFGQSMDRGKSFQSVDELSEGEFKDVDLTTLAKILDDAPKESDTFGYEGKRFTVQHVDFVNKMGLVQRTARKDDDEDDDGSWAPVGKDVTIPEDADDRPGPLFREQAEKRKKERERQEKQAQSDVQGDKHREIPVDDLKLTSATTITVEPDKGKTFCPKCGRPNAVIQEDHPDTDMNELVLSCPDCGHSESR